MNIYLIRKTKKTSLVKPFKYFLRMYLYLKSLHIIFVVTWFSGMFYLVRLFVYNCEANEKTAIEKQILQQQFSVMISRLYWAITLPSAILTLFLGIALLVHFLPLPEWLWIKLGFVLLLYLYQFSLHIIMKQQLCGVFKYSGQQMRLWNEVPTIILVAVIFLVILKNTLSMFYGIIGLFAFIILIFSSIKIYKSTRNA